MVLVGIESPIAFPSLNASIQHMTDASPITAPPTDPPDDAAFTLVCLGGGALLAGWLATAGPPATDTAGTEA